MRVKAKPGYNIILGDINISLQNGRDFIEVDDKLFNKSNDAKKFKHLIEIDTNNTKKIKENKKEPFQVIQTSATSFVANVDQPAKQSGTIVYDPNSEADLKVVQSKQSIDNEKLKADKKKTVNKTDAVKNEINNESVKNDKAEVKANEVDVKETIKDTSAKDETIKLESIKNDEIVKTDTYNESIKSEASKSESTKDEVKHEVKDTDNEEFVKVGDKKGFKKNEKKK